MATKGMAAKDRRLLQARAASLAARGRAADAAVSRPVLVVQCGEDLFGLPLSAAAHVISTPQMTTAAGHPALIGLFNHAGRPHSALDLAVLLGLKPQKSQGVLVVLSAAPWPAALKVDAALGVLPVQAVADDAPRDGAVTGRAVAAAASEAGTRVVSLLDIAVLMGGLNAPSVPGVRS